MSGNELLVAVFGLLIGYWIVSQFGSGKKDNKARSETPSAADAEAQRQREQAHAEAQRRREQAESEARRSREQAEREAQETRQRQRAAEDATPPPWYAILSVAPNADTLEIRRAYKSLMSQYHPDKVAALGPELKELCERKTKEINTAYDRALAERGAA